MSNTPRYVGFLDPPYNVTLTDDSGNALDLTGCTSSSFTLTMLNLNTSLAQQCIGTWTVANQTTNKGQTSYQWMINDMATAGLWWLYTTVKLPGEVSPREFDPELIQILPGTVGAGAAPPGVLPAPIAKALYFNVQDYGASGGGNSDDTAAIQSAINAAVTAGRGVVYFPAGNYKITSSLIIDADRIALVGEGESGTTQIFVPNTADPSYALIIGNTKTVNFCHVRGLTFQGRNDTTSSGGGILFRSNGGSIKQVRVTQFGGTGIYTDSFNTSLIFQVLLEDVYLYQNGGNQATPLDQLFVGYYCSDAEFIRVIAAGGKTLSPTRGRHGIYNNGGSAKFLLCHAYFNPSDGFYQDNLIVGRPSDVQITGGVYETNGGHNIEINHSDRVRIVGVSCYGGTTNRDISMNNNTATQIEGCSLISSTSGNNLGLFGSAHNPITITGNHLANGGGGSQISAPNQVIMMGNTYDSSGNFVIQSTSSLVHVLGNIFKRGSLVEQGSADSNLFADNLFVTAGTGVTVLGSHTKVKRNRGIITEASGTGTITAGTTVVNITHGLQNPVGTGVAPLRVQISPTSGYGTASLYVSGKGTSTFSVTISAVQGSDISFDWRTWVFEE